MNKQRWAVLGFGIAGIVCSLAFVAIQGMQSARSGAYGADSPEAQLGWIGEIFKVVTASGGVSGILAAVVAFFMKWQGISGTAGKSISYAVDVIDVGRIALQVKLYSEATSKSERDSIRSAALIACDELMDSLFPITLEPASEKGGAK